MGKNTKIPIMGPREMETKKSLFLESYATEGTDLAACQAAGIDRSLLKAWKATDSLFVELYKNAREDAIDRVEHAAYRMAVSGKYGDMTKYVLSSLRREVYGNVTRSEVSLVRAAKDMTDEELAEIAASGPVGDGGSGSDL